jgi:hypothetical protein
VIVRRVKRSLLLGAAAVMAVAAAPGTALAVGPPQIVSTSVEAVSATGVTLRAQINANGLSTTYRFEYLTEAAYLANLDANPPREPFQGAALAPPNGAGNAGAGNSPLGVGQRLTELAPSTAYRYRLRAVNSAEPVFSQTRPFGTQAATNVFEPLDDRGWEVVSPIAKNGGSVQPPESIAGGGVFQASSAGGAFTFSSADSFGSAQGAPAGSQYLATLGAGGWADANLTTPLLAGSYGESPVGVPYQLFSEDLSAALLSNGERCRGLVGLECPVANPPLPGSNAPAGYRDYYRRNAAGGFESILTAADLLHTSLSASQFEMRLVGATPDLGHVVVSSCAALAATATEVAAPGGCDPAAQNLYEWAGGALTQINLLPGEATGAPGAELAAPSGAVASNGSRVYFTVGGGLYLREGGVTKTVLTTPGGAFTAAAADGSVAYVIEGGELLRYTASSETLDPVSTGTAVEGVLGVSADGSSVYYAEAGHVFLTDGSTVTEIASSAPPSNWLPPSHVARVSADGSHLVFLSDAELTGYPNEGQTEVFLYGPPPTGGVAVLTCVSCDPSGAGPRGPSSIPGVIANGSGSGAFGAYKPRVLSADSSRVFFDSADSLSAQDTNGQTDVYEWEGDGAGTCPRPGGCVQLISTGRSDEASTFLDASADGAEAFFLTSESIYPLDPGADDVYVARTGGGFTLPPNEPACEGDACQILPVAPEDPIPGTLNPNAGNPPLQAEKPEKKKQATKKKAKKKKKHGKVKAKHGHKKKGGGKK